MVGQLSKIHLHDHKDFTRHMLYHDLQTMINANLKTHGSVCTSQFGGIPHLSFGQINWLKIKVLATRKEERNHKIKYLWNNLSLIFFCLVTGPSTRLLTNTKKDFQVCSTIDQCHHSIKRYHLASRWQRNLKTENISNIPGEVLVFFLLN